MAGAIELRDEAEMIAAILEGKTHLFHELVRPYERSVYLMAFSLLKNESDAEDAAQEALLKAYRNLASFRGDSKFGTWLISITLNEARSRLRRAKSSATQSLDEPADEEGHVSPALLRDWREIPSEALERQEIRQLLQEAVTALPPIYKEIFLMRDVEELSIAEAARLLQITEGLVKVRLHRARILLQKKLAPQLKHANSQSKTKRRWFPWS
jgi:RNA polymerase sigma-70 factor (ECF subfamily)